MRLVQVSIPAGKRETVATVLEEEGVDYMLTDETSGREYTDIAYFPLPTSAVQPILDELKEAGLGDEAHAVIIDAETDTSRRFEELEKRYIEDRDASEYIAREEITTKAREMVPEMQTYLTMTIISAVVATAGLLLDSPAVVVGSMVIAPLIGPAMGASIGTVLSERELFRESVKFQIIGGVAAVLSATVFAVGVRFGLLVPPGTEVLNISQVSGRLTPDFLSLVVALGAGAAGVLSLASGVSVALVGVMIAAALVPPAAAAGVAIAWQQPVAAISSLVLVLVNLFSINLSGLILLWYLGYKPTSWFQINETRATLFKRIGVLVVAIALLSVFLGGVTYATIQDGRFQNQTQDDVEAVLDDTDGAHLLDVSFVGGENHPFDRSEKVIITVGHEPDEEFPDLSDRLSISVNSNTDKRVSVELRFVQIERIPA